MGTSSGEFELIVISATSIKALTIAGEDSLDGSQGSGF
jgi:hypothetical protein